MAAHFDGTEYTEEELEEIRQFAEFVKKENRSRDFRTRLRYILGIGGAAYEQT